MTETFATSAPRAARSPVPASCDGSRQPLRLLLVGPRRMRALGEQLGRVAPAAEIVVVATAAEGERYLDRAEVVMIADRLTPKYVTVPCLRWLHLYPTGVDHVTVPALREAPFVVTHKVGASVIPLAEHLMALLLAIVRRLPDYRDLQARRQWQHHSQWPTTELRQLDGTTLGIVGLGNAGLAAARRARAFGMRVIGTKRTPVKRLPHVAAVFPPERLHGVLAASDFVAILTPLTDETHHLMGEPEFRAMKPTAYFVNVGRRPTVEQAALTRALLEGWIAGAALDVFEPEPLDPSSPLWSLPNVIVTPHAAGSGPDNERDATEEIIANLHRYLRGRPLRGQLKRSEIVTRFEAPRH